MIPLETISSSTQNNLLLYVAILGILLLIASLIRLKVGFLKKWYIPASLLAGVFGLLLGPFFLNIIPKEIMDSWSALGGVLMTVVLAPAMMRAGSAKTKGLYKKAIGAACFTYSVTGMQFAVPMILTMLIFTPLMNVNPLFAGTFEGGWAGGHGVAAAMTPVFEQLGWGTEGTSLTIVNATFGLLVGLIGGIILINIAVRKGWTKTLKNTTTVNLSFFENKLRLTGDFTFRTKDYIQDKKDTAIPYSTKEGEISYLGIPETGDYIATTTQSTTYLATNAYAEYENTFAEKHHIKLLGGYNYEQQDYRALTAQSYGLLMPDLDNIAFAQADEGKSISSSANRWRYVGAFFRINYSYDDRYLFEINGRYDGSSKFPNNSQWGFFPSASAAWRVSEEPFWNVNPKAISNLKIRASYGALGNSNVSPYT